MARTWVFGRSLVWCLTVFGPRFSNIQVILMIGTQETRRVELTCGDIAQQQVDAIVNAANSRLVGGGGVDGAIHRRGGPTLMTELRRYDPRGCPTGEAVLTSGGNLNCRFVFHAVGPIWQGGGAGEEALLVSAVRACLSLAEKQRCRSIAFPALSCGVYGYPVDRAAGAMLRAVRNWQAEHESPELVRFVLYDEVIRDVFCKAWQELQS